MALEKAGRRSRPQNSTGHFPVPIKLAFFSFLHKLSILKCRSWWLLSHFLFGGQKLLNLLAGCILKLCRAGGLSENDGGRVVRRIQI